MKFFLSLLVGTLLGVKAPWFGKETANTREQRVRRSDPRSTSECGVSCMEFADQGGDSGWCSGCSGKLACAKVFPTGYPSTDFHPLHTIQLDWKAKTNAHRQKASPTNYYPDPDDAPEQGHSFRLVKIPNWSVTSAVYQKFGPCKTEIENDIEVYRVYAVVATSLKVEANARTYDAGSPNLKAKHITLKLPESINPSGSLVSWVTNEIQDDVPGANFQGAKLVAEYTIPSERVKFLSGGVKKSFLGLWNLNGNNPQTDLKVNMAHEKTVFMLECQSGNGHADTDCEDALIDSLSMKFVCLKGEKAAKSQSPYLQLKKAIEKITTKVTGDATKHVERLLDYINRYSKEAIKADQTLSDDCKKEVTAKVATAVKKGKGKMNKSDDKAGDKKTTPAASKAALPVFTA